MTSSGPRPAANSWRDWGCGLLAVLVFAGLAYWSLEAHLLRWWSPSPDGYYGGLTEAFSLGQLHLAIDVDPRLLALENPYAGPQGTSRPHDMSFYNGKFYLYYGAAPVFLIFWPWLILTGTYLSEAVGSLFLLVTGFAAATLWLTRIKRAYFPEVSSIWLLVMTAIMGGSLPLLEALANDTFYGVPIHSGFACLMIALVCLDVALRRATWGARASWLALASTAWGLAVASRPIFVLSLLFLGLAALWLAFSERRQADFRRRAFVLLTSAIAPAAFIGAALMLYNFLRFDDPLDFGIRFSMATEDLREARLVGPEFLANNYLTYLLRPGDYLRYFPFFLTSDWPVGMLRYIPLLWLAPFFPVLLLARRFRTTDWFWSNGAALGAGVATLTMLSLFFGSQPRYLLDFAPPALLAAQATALGLLAFTARRGPARWLTRGLVIALALWSITHSALNALAVSHQVTFRDNVARWLHQPVAWFERLAGTPHGALELEVRFPIDKIGRTEPLLTTGGIYGNGDVITVTYLESGEVQFGTFKSGAGGARSIPVAIEPGAVQTIELLTGGLLPPVTHPFYRDLPQEQRDALRRQVVITLNGQTVLRAAHLPYPASPGLRYIGQSPLGSDASAPAFTGEIVKQTYRPLDFADLDLRAAGHGPVELLLSVSSAPVSPGLPLITSGRHGAGDLITMEILPGNLVRFGHDHWGDKLVLTRAVPLPPENPFTVYVEYGGLMSPPDPATAAPQQHRFMVALNGEPLINMLRPFHRSHPAEIEFGYNTLGASGAVANFRGTIHEVRRVTPLEEDQLAEPWGPVRLAVRFPADRIGVREPLLITGTTGRADVLFVEYAENAVRFGHDHWGVGAALGPWLPVDFAALHRLEFDLASLYPPPDDPAWASHGPRAQTPATVVHLNHQEALRSEFVAFPAPATSLAIGRNEIGASTCDTAFSGQILLRRREPW